MRFITFSIAAVFLYISTNWENDFPKAIEKARTENKYIVLNFSGSDWCIPCIRMHKEMFDSPEFTEYANQHLVLVNADFPRLKKNQLSKEQVKKNEQLADSYNPDGTFPLTLLLDANGKVIKRWEGYPDLKPAEFVNSIKSVMDARN
jgi:thioredoxin-related protein